MKTFLLFIYFGGSISFCFAQKNKKPFLTKEDTATLHIREVAITIDTTIEYNNPKGNINIDFLTISKGLRITIFDNIFRVLNFDEYADSNLNGIHMEFYLPSNMPKVRGKYLNNEKDGEWFFWNEQGKLIKKEFWSNGCLARRSVPK